MSKLVLFSVVLGLIISFSYFIYRNAKPDVGYIPGRWPEADVAVNQAGHFYQVAKSTGTDFSKGFCLANDLMPGWVADIVHSPRQIMDDLPENQCPSYLEGKVKHFVELDTEGNLIRVK